MFQALPWRRGAFGTMVCWSASGGQLSCSLICRGSLERRAACVRREVPSGRLPVLPSPPPELLTAPFWSPARSPTAPPTPPPPPPSARPPPPLAPPPPS